MTVDMLRKIINLYISNLNLKSVRLCTLFVLGFSGFLRYSELADIRMNDLQICEGHIKINIKRSKTDQYRQGQNIIIAKTGSDLCPVFWLNKYITLANLIQDQINFCLVLLDISNLRIHLFYVGQNCHIQELEKFFSKP